MYINYIKNEDGRRTKCRMKVKNEDEMLDFVWKTAVLYEAGKINYVIEWWRVDKSTKVNVINENKGNVDTPFID